jgi:hypothetical protein
MTTDLPIAGTIDADDLAVRIRLVGAIGAEQAISRERRIGASGAGPASSVSSTDRVGDSSV